MRAASPASGTIDRIVYENYEPLTALAAAAAVTERIGLCTSVLLGPLRDNPSSWRSRRSASTRSPAAASRSGIGLGGRDDDYEVSGVELAARRQLDAMLEGSRRSGRGRDRPDVAGAAAA